MLINVATFKLDIISKKCIFKFINIKLVHFLSDSQQQEGIHASTDTCWQKKGSGRAYNSLSGLF